MYNYKPFVVETIQFMSRITHNVIFESLFNLTVRSKSQIYIYFVNMQKIMYTVLRLFEIRILNSNQTCHPFTHLLHDCFLCNCLIILFLWFEKSSFTLIFERWMYIYFPMNEIQKYLHVSYYTHFIKTIDSHSQNRLTIETLIQKFYAFSNSPSKSKEKKKKE